YPNNELGLNALVQRPPNEPRWNGPYLRKNVPLDPWGRPYLYKIPGEKGEYDLISYGKDGQPGGTGENADLTNH
ncbi:MAG TPA: type II secretion system major pseudopilin GspG, partial [Burkholderiales bacterium]|nr:type II secretion system major pseudopilin GspG [Burkholderiales bacterium]